MIQPTVVDLFCGVGGLSLGAARAGFDVIGGIDCDILTLQTHAKNFPEAKHIHDDLLTMQVEKIKSEFNCSKITGLVGGPPCQGFSNIGKGNINDSRNRLFIRFFEIVRDVKPAFFLAENVLGVLNAKYKQYVDYAMSLVKDYILLEPIIVKANEYGAPTTRTRVFFFGYKSDELSLVTSADFETNKVSDNQKVCVAEALSGLPEISQYERSDTKNNIGFISSKSEFFNSRITGFVPEKVGCEEAINNYINFGKVTGCMPTRHSENILVRYGKLKYGEKDPISKSVKLNPDGFCPTLRAGTGPDRGSFQAVRPIHYKYPRVITPREAARLQGFPDWFVFHPTKWHSFRQIGNSVSPLVAEKILAVIYHKVIK